MEITPSRASSLSTGALQPGTPIMVRNSLNLWSPGFQIEAWRDDRCQVRRSSDGALIPRSFATEDIRPT
jgi:hypothetical protein